MRVLVVGGGIGGLTTAIALRRKGHVVTLIEKRGRLKSLSDNMRKTTKYVGLWSPSLKCLHSLDVYDKIINDLEFVGKSGYKDPTGRWLMNPKVGLTNTPLQGSKSASLGFINEDLLMNVLTDQCIALNVNLQYNESFSHVKKYPSFLN